MKDKKYHIPNEFELYFKDQLIVLKDILNTEMFTYHRVQLDKFLQREQAQIKKENIISTPEAVLVLTSSLKPILWAKMSEERQRTLL